MKILCFGVRDYEMDIFHTVERECGYEFILSSQYLNNDNYECAYGYNAIIVRANCVFSENSLKKLYDHGLRFILTRTIGYDHIPLDYCKRLGIKVAYAPGYSPASIAELSIALAMNLFCKINEVCVNTSQYDFTLPSTLMRKEIVNSTVGIIGVGRIGKAVSRVYRAMGADVLGYDIYEDPAMRGIVRYVDLDTLLERADIISIHLSNDLGDNYHLINEARFKRMKQDVLLVNTARGEIVDTEALVKYIKNGKVLGAGIDVLENEKDVFFKKRKVEELDPVARELVSLYPRVIITPHISSSTVAAVYDSLRITVDNLTKLITQKECENELV